MGLAAKRRRATGLWSSPPFCRRPLGPLLANLLPLFSSSPPFSHSSLTRRPGCWATGQWSSAQPGGGGGRGHCDRKLRAQVGHFRGKISSPLDLERTKAASSLFCVGWRGPTMSRSLGAGSPPLPPRSAPVPARSGRCEVRSPEGDVSLWRAPSEGAGARVPRGAGKAGKVEAEHGPVSTYLPGVENVGHRSNVGVSESEFVCARATVPPGRGQFQSTDLLSGSERYRD